MSFSPLWGAGGAYLNDIELPPCGKKTFRVSERVLSRSKFGYLTPNLVKIRVETLKVWKGSNFGYLRSVSEQFMGQFPNRSALYSKS